MQDLFNKWYAQVNGKAIEAEDPSNKFQCMDLMFNWCDYIKIPREAVRHFYAYQVFTQPNSFTTQYFDLIYNSPTNTPQVGDIVVFDQKVGYAGHVSMDSGKSNSKDALTEDQNWNGLLYARPVTHYNYYGVMGWLHPKVQTPVTNYDAILNQIRDIINIGGDSKVRFDKIKELVNKV